MAKRWRCELTDTEIAIRIVPRRLRWPAPGTNSAWTKAHACVDAFHDVIRKVDLGCLEAEQDRVLSASGIARRRAELCNQAMTKLASLTPFQIAEKAIIERIDLPERPTGLDTQKAQMTKALADLREGVEATQRMVLERCKMREERGRSIRAR